MNNCIVCKHKLRFFCKTNNFSVEKCVNCGFGATDNLRAHTNDYHRDETYLKEVKLFTNIFNKRIKVINKVIKNPGRVLEIGCSTGLFLSLMRNKGWRVLGVEVSKKSAETAVERGIEVLNQPFEKIQFKEKFDLVILNHTLEHLEDPIGVLNKTKQLLKPKGFLYIDLPNFDSLSAKIYKSKWGLLLPEEHLWHFTEKSFDLIFREMGLKKVFCDKSSGIWDFGNPVKELLVSLLGFKKRFFGEFFTLIPSFIVSKIGLGSDLMVIARKK